MVEVKSNILWGDYAAVGSSQRAGVGKDPKGSLTTNELIKSEAYSSGRTLAGPSSSGHDIYQGSPSPISGECCLFHYFKAHGLFLSLNLPASLILKSFFNYKTSDKSIKGDTRYLTCKVNEVR